MKQILTFLFALLFAMSGRAMPAHTPLGQLSNESDPTTSFFDNLLDDEVSRAIAEARKAVQMSNREVDKAIAEVDKVIAETCREVEIAVAEAGRYLDTSDREIDREIDLAIAEAKAAITAAERIDLSNQSIEELNKAAHEQVVKELGLSSKQRKEFDPIYKAYREALDKAIDADANRISSDESTQKESLKAKLSNISATADVKRDYVDKFAAVLTSEQIRQLYNIEGSIGTNIKRSDASRRRDNNNHQLKGSGRMVTQNIGSVGNYSALSVGHSINLTLSPSATGVTVTADDNVIDYLVVENKGGRLEIRINANSISNISVSVVAPVSTNLSEINASAYSKVDCKLPLKGSSVKIVSMSGASVAAKVDAGDVRLEVASYGKFEGDIQCTNCTADITSGASAKANITSSRNCTLTTTSYGKFSGDIKAASIKVTIPSGASVGGALKASEQLTLNVNSYGKFNGAMQAKQAQFETVSGGTITGTFAGDSFTAKANSYGKINLKGSATVATGSADLASGGTFDAPDLRVGNYDITANSYGKANVYCTQKMATSTTSGGQIRYDGNCTVESRSESVRRR